MDKSERDAKSAAGREEAKTERQAYTARKKKVLKLEEKNYGCIYLVKSVGEGWHKIFGRSAIFYKQKLYPELIKRAKYASLNEPNLQKDDDHEFKSDIGFISIRSKSKFVGQMATLGLKMTDSEEEGILTVELKQKSSKKDFVDLLEEEAAKWNEVNEVILAEARMTSAAKSIREMSQRLYDFARKMKTEQKELVGMQIVQVSGKALALHYAAEKGHVPLDEYFPKEKLYLDELFSLLSIAFDANMVPVSTALKLSEKVATALEAVEKTERKFSRNAV